MLNTIPELGITSCNTVCNSKITCIEIIPPSTQISDSKPKLRDNLLKNLILPKSETVESIVNTESSDEEELILNRAAFESEYSNPSNAINFNIAENQDINERQNKYSSIWFGTEDGRFVLIVFNLFLFDNF